MRKKYIIIGFPKAGQISLIRYLREVEYVKEFRNKEYVIKKDELIWNRKGPEIFEQKYGRDAFPIIIERDPIERMWSGYNYFQFGGDDWEHGHGDPPICEQMSFPEYLDMKGYEHHLGEMNPVSQSNYAKWFEHWKNFTFTIYHLEALRQEKEFPHLNITSEVRKKKVLPMPEEYRKLARTKLEQEIQEHKEPSWSIDYM